MEKIHIITIFTKTSVGGISTQIYITTTYEQMVDIFMKQYAIFQQNIDLTHGKLDLMLPLTEMIPPHLRYKDDETVWEVECPLIEPTAEGILIDIYQS